MQSEREWAETKAPEETIRDKRVFITSLAGADDARLGKIVREHWAVENKIHHKRDDSVWQEDRHLHRRPNVALNLALTRNALLAIIPFDEKHNLPSLIADYQNHPSRAINLILNGSSAPSNDSSRQSPWVIDHLPPYRASLTQTPEVRTP